MFKWDVQRVAAAIHAEVAEGQSLEFKAELPDRTDKGKAEFLKDVSALANATGGAILFGVVEKSGKAESLAGLQLSNPDAEVLRLSQILEAGIEPRVAGIQFAPLKLGESDVLVVDVPQSFDAPHRYLFNGHSRFVQRAGNHVSELNYDQLRSAFNRSGERVSRIREQWASDFGLAKAWRPFRDGPVCVLRLSSLLAADGRQVIDPQTAQDFWSDLIQSDWGGGSPIYNYEGLVVAPGRQERDIEAYTQVHRSGAITSYRVVGREWEGDNIFIPGWAERFLLEALPKAHGFLRAQGIAGSAILHMGISNLRGRKFVFTDHGFTSHSSVTIDRLELPEVLIDNLSDELNLDAMMKPGFDLIWQAYGQPRCGNYTPDGIWKRQY
jgi:hypothetical protein